MNAIVQLVPPAAASMPTPSNATPRDLVAKIPGLSADQRQVLEAIADRPRSMAELRAGQAWTFKRTREVFGELERQHWIVLYVRARKAEDHTYVLAEDFLDHVAFAKRPRDQVAP